MSRIGIEALTAGREDVLAVARTLTAEEWAAPSGCAGWRVQDVVAHMACVFRQVVDPASMPQAIAGDIEGTQELGVAQRKDWDAARVLAEYEEMSTAGLAAVEGLQEGPMADAVVPLDNLGKHPLHLLANAFAFDHYCHLRNDILAPLGPVTRRVKLDDAVRVEATLEWLVSGLPQMAPDAMRAAVTRPITLRLTGDGGGTWALFPADGDDLVRVEEDEAPGDTSIISPATEFVVWGTHRRPWRECDVRVEGDEAYGAAVLDAIHVF